MTTLAPLAAQAAAATDQAKLRAAAKGFEAVFTRQMIASMRSASLGDGLLDSSATEQFRDMGDARTAEMMAEKGALGIAEMMIRQLSPKRVMPAAAGIPSSGGKASNPETPASAGVTRQ